MAGAGRLPGVLAQAVRARGRALVLVQMADEGPAPAVPADIVVRVPPEAWPQLVEVWRQHGVREVVLAGRFDRARVLARVFAPGSAMRDFAEGLADRREQSVLTALAGDLAREGIRVVDQRHYVADCVPRPGLLAGPPLSAGERRDVDIGLGVARTLAGLDVGQTVVLRHGVVLAVEAAEGTDATIRRGGALAAGAVVVKASRPEQDPRFDIPTVGSETLAVMRAVSARVLAVEAGRTIVLDGAELPAAAAAAGISVLAVEAPPLRSPGDQP